MGRSKKIFDRIKLLMGVDHTLDDSLVFQIMTEAQTDIAEGNLCIETSDTLPILSNTATYDEPNGFYRLKLIALSNGLVIEPEEVDKKEMDNIQKLSPFIGVGRIVYTRWNGQITFYPTPSATDTYTLYYYAIPTAAMSQSSEPQTPPIFDKAIQYGALIDIFLLTGKQDQVPLYTSLYGQELQRAMTSWRRTKTTSLEIYPQEV